MNLLTIQEVASKLKISKASVKNWEKQGYLAPVHNKLYSPSDVSTLQSKLDSGELKRLESRANKSRSKNQFIPLEYLKNPESITGLEEIITFITKYNIKPEQALFLLAINALVKTDDIEKEHLYEALKFENSNYFKRESVFEELKNWYEQIHKKEIKKDNLYCNFLLEVPLPTEIDLLGIIHQSIMQEGTKSSLGSYYTPPSLVSKIVKDNITPESKVLDPCCGTGQFLLTMADDILDPNLIWGADIDEIAVRIAKVNLLLHYHERDFTPNIFHCNSLTNWVEGDFSLIATNPPWGAKINLTTLKQLKDIYPEIQSKESFSFFLTFALTHLKNGGIYSFVLPESILYVKNHQDIRSHLLNNSQIKFIQSGGRMFKNVFSSVIRIDGINTLPVNDTVVKLETTQNEYSIKQNRFLSNHNRIIDLYCSNTDQNIIENVYNKPHVTLENSADWALGIVTGNNNLHIKKIIDENLEPLFKGKDLEPLKFKLATNYIEFNPKLFQQCAPEHLYRAPEKLVYKFISKDLVFAYDDKQLLTLNSANILIPKVPNYPIKIIGALFNSALYKFIYKKKFNALKVLRGDIETLPIPNLTSDEKKILTSLSNRVISNEIEYKDIDDYIFNLFEISDEYKSKIMMFLES
ncbi:MAG: N-6 DNA methylase [Spirochaetaceae bacterium]